MWLILLTISCDTNPSIASIFMKIPYWRKISSVRVIPFVFIPDFNSNQSCLELSTSIMRRDRSMEVKFLVLVETVLLFVLSSIHKQAVIYDWKMFTRKIKSNFLCLAFFYFLFYFLWFLVQMPTMKQICK